MTSYTTISSYGGFPQHPLHLQTTHLHSLPNRTAQSAASFDITSEATDVRVNAEAAEQSQQHKKAQQHIYILHRYEHMLVHITITNNSGR